MWKGYHTPGVKDDGTLGISWLRKSAEYKHNEGEEPQTNQIYSPQQYEYLAGVLQKSGSPKEANTVLYASRERSRARAREQHNWGRSILMWLQKWTIGYGIGLGYFRALLWVIALTVVGFLAISPSSMENWNYRLLYASVDNILPVIKLSYPTDIHTDFISKLDNWPLLVFNLIKVLGYMLAIFIAAGFAGLTQKK